MILYLHFPDRKPMTISLQAPHMMTPERLAGLLAFKLSWNGKTGWMSDEEMALLDPRKPFGLQRVADQDHLFLFPISSTPILLY